jgi:hypothetical protein
MPPSGRSLSKAKIFIRCESPLIFSPRPIERLGWSMKQAEVFYLKAFEAYQRQIGYQEG